MQATIDDSNDNNINNGSANDTTFRRDLEIHFQLQRGIFKADLHKHTSSGGRLSLTTDAWSARNYQDHAAVTVHYITKQWEQKEAVLDVVHLNEPIHSVEYLADVLVSAMDDFGITSDIFTVTRDNDTTNTVMLEKFEAIAATGESTLLHPLAFSMKEGEVRCVAHIINIAAQCPLKTLNADPADDSNSYRLVDDWAHLPSRGDRDITISTCLAKLRRHIYAFSNRRGWRDALSDRQQHTVSSPVPCPLICR